MIITRTPYRISLFGGSTDYESFYERYSSFLVGFSINQYCYSICKHFPDLQDSVNFQVYYSNVEKVPNISDISNPGVKGVLEFLQENDNKLANLAIYIQNDLPSRTGIGSSSSLIVGLLNGLSQGTKNKKQLATEAIEIERYRLKEPGGIQDQIFAAYGGFNKIEIYKNGDFFVKPLSISLDFIEEFQKHCILFYTNGQRNSFELAASHDTSDADRYKKRILDIAKQGVFEFESENIYNIGLLLDKNWENKKKISTKISNEYIDSLYDTIKKNGGIGAKLLGSGESGFMFCVVDKDKKQKIIDTIKLPTVDIGFDFEGSKVLLNGI